MKKNCNYSALMPFRVKKEREIPPSWRLQPTIWGDFSAFGLEMACLNSYFHGLFLFLVRLVRVRVLEVAGVVICLGLLTGCTLSMRQQSRQDPFEENPFFEDGASARQPVAGGVSRGSPQLDGHLYTGRFNGEFAPTFPFTVTRQVLERGHERYDIFCSPCHGYVGDGQGVVVEYGMRQPPSFHDPDLRAEPPGYYFDLITNGTRVMPAYADRIRPEDRWAIVAYIRALQLSQQADPSQVPPEELPNLE